MISLGTTAFLTQVTYKAVSPHLVALISSLVRFEFYYLHYLKGAFLRMTKLLSER